MTFTFRDPWRPRAFAVQMISFVPQGGKAVWSRREFGLGCVAAAFAGASARAALDGASQFAALERAIGGRIGVAALDTGSGRRLAHRAGEHFAMCSTFKWLLAAAILSQCDRGKLALDQRIAYSDADVLAHSPVTRAYLSQGAMRIVDLCAAAVQVSDNGAANLLLARIGGPRGLTTFLRSIGDKTTRLDRFEPGLNENRPGDRRDTTTPNAMVATMNNVLAGEILAPSSRLQLIVWMRNCTTGSDRLRAGLPRSWIVGDKTGIGTGSGTRSAINDVAIAWPPNRAPILIASYISGSRANAARQNTAHARIARIVARAFA